MRVLLLSAYAVAMAYVEAMVVVYIRRLLPEKDLGFISLDRIETLLRDNHIYLQEQTREAATIVMLLSIAWLSGRGFRDRAAAFLWCFGLWDIFYYVFLRLWLGWPTSLMDMDILFLIPGPWVAPVLLPVSVSVVMLFVAGYLFRSAERV